MKIEIRLLNSHYTEPALYCYYDEIIPRIGEHIAYGKMYEVIQVIHRLEDDDIILMVKEL